MIVLVFLVCFFASVIGAICGIGGGVLIKPALDALGIMDVATISFLSGCTVLSMTTYNVVRSKLAGESKVDTATGLPMALGAAVGGVFGKQESDAGVYGSVADGRKRAVRGDFISRYDGDGAF